MQRGDHSPLPELHSIITPQMRDARRDVLESFGLATPTPGESTSATSPVEATTSRGPGKPVLFLKPGIRRALQKGQLEQIPLMDRPVDLADRLALGLSNLVLTVDREADFRPSSHATVFGC